MDLLVFPVFATLQFKSFWVPKRLMTFLNGQEKKMFCKILLFQFHRGTQIPPLCACNHSLAIALQQNMLIVRGIILGWPFLCASVLSSFRQQCNPKVRDFPFLSMDSKKIIYGENSILLCLWFFYKDYISVTATTTHMTKQTSTNSDREREKSVLTTTIEHAPIWRPGRYSFVFHFFLSCGNSCIIEFAYFISRNTAD